MPTLQPARIFISYATRDGAEYAAKLRHNLEAHGFSIWQDIVALQGNADWWSQIETTLRAKELQHFILVVTPGALASPVVRREIRLARQEGKTVSPVRGPGIESMAKLPRWLGNLYDLDLPERRTNLLRVLELPGETDRVPMMAPEPPVDFVPRPVEFEALKHQLLDAKGDAVAITAALRGAGGYGKTTLARKLAHDEDVQEAYFDGILWVELGEQGGGRVLALIADLVALLTGEARNMHTIEAARTALGEALGDRRILLVIDDVWQKHHLDPFLHEGRNTTRLVTTRFDTVLPDKAVRQPVDAMQLGEALALIAWDLPPEQVSAETKPLADLARRLGEWAQLLKLANGFLREGVNAGQSLREAIVEANLFLDQEGLTAFDSDDADDRSKAVAKTIGVSLRLLAEDERARFAELGIFPEDADVPIGIVERLWQTTGELSALRTGGLLRKLKSLSLLLDLDLDRRTTRLHDTTRQFLQDEARRNGQLAAQHSWLVDAMAELGDTANASPADTIYFYQHLPEHLADAGDRKTLDALLLDPAWLQAKLEATGNPQLLVSDYEQHGRGQLQNLIGRTLRLTTGICARDQRQLLPQLVGRLMACADTAAPAFLDQARSLIRRPALLPYRPSLTPPGAETARFEGHTGGVTALAVLPDGRIASGSLDGTIRLWDLRTGAEVARLEGNNDSVRALVMLPDGRLASGSIGSSDEFRVWRRVETIRLWDPARAVAAGRETSRYDIKPSESYDSYLARGNIETAPFTTSTYGVWSLSALPDGQIASGSDDNTIRLWDPRIDAETARLEGHTKWVNTLVVLPDGRLASGSDDSTIRVWDLSTGAETARFEGHTRRVIALVVLPDGRLASGSADSTIRLWDLSTCAETARLEGHTGWVSALAVLTNAAGKGWRLASGSHDDTIRLWDLSTGTETARFEGHTAGVGALLALPDGHLVSGAYDKTIRLWDPRISIEPPYVQGHAAGVNALVVLDNGRLASAGHDDTIRVWDIATGAEADRLSCCTGEAHSLAVLPDGRLASCSADFTFGNAIRLWDTASGAESGRLEVFGGIFRALAVLPNGRLARGCTPSYGDDFVMIQVWDVTIGAETARFEDHTADLNVLLALPDGRLASGSDDNIIRIWDPNTGAATDSFAGHAGGVHSLAALPDGRIASGSHDTTIRLWDLRTGVETARLEGHNDRVTALVVLPDGRLASGSEDKAIRLWAPNIGRELCCLEVDSPILCLVVLPNGRLVAGDKNGRLHWLEIVD